MEIVNYIVDQRLGCAWWRLGLCVPWVFFFEFFLSFFWVSFFLLGSFFFFWVFFFLGFVLLSSGFFLLFLGFYFFFEIECKRLETRDLCGINVSNSTSRKRVFETQVLYGTQVSKTRDASLQIPFIPVLIYYILSPHCASLQISP